MNDNQATQQFAVQRVYLKDTSLEVPNAPQVFNETWQPEVNVQIGNTTNQINDNLYEAVLSVTVTAKAGDKTIYLVEVKQAGLFVVQGFDEDQRNRLLGAFCPNTLFPFAREVVSSLLTKANFPPLMLHPINFDALYNQHLKTQTPQPI